MKNPLKIADLRHRLQTLGHPGGDTDFPRRSVVRFGVPALDRALPWGGLPPSCLHEIAGRDDEAAAHGFATALLTRFAEEQSILWCRLRRATRDMGVPYGPGLARFGLKPEHVLFAEATRPIDVLWTLEEGLRTKGPETRRVSATNQCT